MDQYGRLGSKNGFNNNTKFINPTAETKNTCKFSLIQLITDQI